MLHRLEHAGERRQASARVRLTAFYEQASAAGTFQLGKTKVFLGRGTAWPAVDCCC